MRTILLPFCDDDVSQKAFEVSARLARRMNGYLEGLFVMRRPQILEGDGDMLADSHFTQLIEECRRSADLARARFTACAAQEGLPLETIAASKALAAGWREIEGMDEQVIGSHGRLFELIVIGREFGRTWLNWRSMLESALFESGRPVLLTPEKIGATLAENVLIAWNPSTETARTVAFAMPLLERARTVTVMSIEGWGSPGPTDRELATYLARTGVPATARTVDAGSRSPGATILEECTRSGADLLIKGAYTQSRLRKLIFGGATRHVIAHAQLPVVLSN